MFILLALAKEQDRVGNSAYMDWAGGSSEQFAKLAGSSAAWSTLSYSAMKECTIAAEDGTLFPRFAHQDPYRYHDQNELVIIGL